MHKLVNIGCLNQYGLVRFSFIFTTTEEFKTIQNIVYDYRKEIEKKEIPNEPGEVLQHGAAIDQQRHDQGQVCPFSIWIQVEFHYLPLTS